MAYRQSRARRRFDVEVGRLLGTVREAHSSKCSSSAVREFALCSAVLLCSARMESYIEDLLADWGGAVKTQILTTEKLPRRIRAFLLNQPAVVAAYRQYIVDGDEAGILTKLETLIGGPHYDFAIDGRRVPPFAVEVVYKDRKYPSPKNIRKLFGRFGVMNVFDELDRIARRDTEAMLTSFNDLRTEMAHVGVPVGLNAADIKQHIQNVQTLVGYIDRMFFGHVSRSVGAACWMV